MPMIGLSVYNIDFFILDNNNPKTIVILDQSSYLDTPEKPVYSIKLPGYSTGVVIPYTINSINIINSNILGLTSAVCNDELNNLPDGLYEITQMVCPYDELYKTQLLLKTTQLECKYKKFLLNLDCSNLNEKDIIHIDILIQSAKAEAEYNNKEKAIEKYQAAVLAVQQLIKKINCN